MTNKWNASKAAIALTAVMCLALPGLNSAQLRTTKINNWMYEFVELRISAMTARASAGSRARVSGDLFQPRIVGGTIAGETDNAFQVGLLRKGESNNSRAQYCGGTLVKPNVVVTAAHCSDFVDATEVQVLTGTRKLDGSGMRRNVSKITVHPDWSAETFDNDVAVWTLSSSAGGIKLATLATSDASVGDPLLATGWGALKQGGGAPIDLMKVSLPLVATANCNDTNSYNGSHHDKHDLRWA